MRQRRRTEDTAEEPDIEDQPAAAPETPPALTQLESEWNRIGTQGTGQRLLRSIAERGSSAAASGSRADPQRGHPEDRDDPQRGRSGDDPQRGRPAVAQPRDRSRSPTLFAGLTVENDDDMAGITELRVFWCTRDVDNQSAARWNNSPKNAKRKKNLEKRGKVLKLSLIHI